MTRRLFRRFAPLWFSLTASERRGYLSLGLLLALLMGINYGMDLFPPSPPLLPPMAIPEEFARKIDQRLDPPMVERYPFDPNLATEETLISMGLPRNVAQNMVRYRERGGKFRRAADVQRMYGMSDTLYAEILPFIAIGILEDRLEPAISDNEHAVAAKSEIIPPPPNYFLFDPNTATAEELSLLGFTSFQSRNLIAYRERGGRINRAEDLLRIYGLESSDFLLLEPWVKIDAAEERMVESEFQVMDLNRADSVALLALPGIGPVFAGRIVRYRNQLGGFSEVAQLMEVYGMSQERFEGVARRVVVNEFHLRQLRLNFSDNSEMVRHPYIDAALARKIVAERSSGGPFETLDAFAGRIGIEVQAMAKISPYLTCE